MYMPTSALKKWVFKCYYLVLNLIIYLFDIDVISSLDICSLLDIFLYFLILVIVLIFFIAL